MHVGAMSGSGRGVMVLECQQGEVLEVVVMGRG